MSNDVLYNRAINMLKRLYILDYEWSRFTRSSFFSITPTDTDAYIDISLQWKNAEYLERFIKDYELFGYDKLQLKYLNIEKVLTEVECVIIGNPCFHLNKLYKLMKNQSTKSIHPNAYNEVVTIERSIHERERLIEQNIHAFIKHRGIIYGTTYLKLGKTKNG